MKVHKSTPVVFLCLVFSLSTSGQEKQPRNANSSCREFVGKFYSWYLANASKTRPGPASRIALKYRSYLFAPALVQALKEDDEAQEKAGSDLVSLDGDPFVGADGLSEGYVVEKVTVTDERCWAAVHAVRAGKEDETPDVTAEVQIKNGAWRFVNFYFPSESDPKGWDLLGALKALRKGENR
jgi:hypothetical protein